MTFEERVPLARYTTLGTGGPARYFARPTNLAELEEALRFYLERVERFELDGEPEYDTLTGVYGLRRLPVRMLPACP